MRGYADSRGLRVIHGIRDMSEEDIAEIEKASKSFYEFLRKLHQWRERSRERRIMICEPYLCS